MKAQEDIAGGQKREVEEEDPYNEENIEQVGSSAGNQSQRRFSFFLKACTVLQYHNPNWSRCPSHSNECGTP